MCSLHDPNGEHAAELQRAQQDVAESVTGLQRFFRTKDQDFMLDRRLIPEDCLRSYGGSQAKASRAFLDMLAAGHVDIWETMMSQAWKLRQAQILSKDLLSDIEEMLHMFAMKIPLNSVDDTLQGRHG